MNSNILIDAILTQLEAREAADRKAKKARRLAKSTMKAERRRHRQAACDAAVIKAVRTMVDDLDRLNAGRKELEDGLAVVEGNLAKALGR